MGGVQKCKVSVFRVKLYFCQRKFATKFLSNLSTSNISTSGLAETGKFLCVKHFTSKEAYLTVYK